MTNNIKNKLKITIMVLFTFNFLSIENALYHSMFFGKSHQNIQVFTSIFKFKFQYVGKILLPRIMMIKMKR
ncbi:hypothetical protein ABE26_11740 [Cytobacillus firmus]|nr:hypothetical protein [Cytobacillus firmus]